MGEEYCQPRTTLECWCKACDWNGWEVVPDGATHFDLDALRRHLHERHTAAEPACTGEPLCEVIN